VRDAYNLPQVLKPAGGSEAPTLSGEVTVATRRRLGKAGHRPRLLHRRSSRASSAFVALPEGALPGSQRLSRLSAGMAYYSRSQPFPFAIWW